jgi:dinuclear metal center YbgI/SA1388 family protein
MSAVISVPLHEITAFLDRELEISRYNDQGYNGLQVESTSTSVQKIACAVDAGFSVAERAVESGCQLLVVHHGILWGQSEPFVGPLARKLHLLFSRGLSLYAAHLPLDGHLLYGNAARLSSEIGAYNVSPCFEYKGATIGVQAEFASPVTLDDVISRVSSFEGALCPPIVLPFGKRIIQRIGIATGSATGFIRESALRGLDLLITGEPKQEAYHTAREYQCSVLCVGHYASETFGVRALERVLAERFRVETVWISEPTGI